MRHRTLLLAIVTAGLFTAASYAQAPAAPAAPAEAPAGPAVQAVTTTPPAPTAPAAPVQAAAPVVLRREEENPAAPTATLPPSPLATRISGALTALRGQGAVVQQLADRDATISQLRSQLAAANSQVTSLTAEVTQFRADHAALQTAVSQLESSRTNVTNELAAIGFPAASLPDGMPEGGVTDGPSARAHYLHLRKTDKSAAMAFYRQNKALLRQGV